ncbi:MAG: helix-turn-helix domain-containing protein [Alphaproteobacteria bacterium]
MSIIHIIYCINAKIRDWDDIQYFLTLERTSALSGAASDLGVNHSTVFRRVNQLEERVGARFFERHLKASVVAARDARSF